MDQRPEVRAGHRAASCPWIGSDLLGATPTAQATEQTDEAADVMKINCVQWSEKATHGVGEILANRTSHRQFVFRICKNSYKEKPAIRS